MPEKSYIAIDLKSFYASAECVSRRLDPLHTNLVVADPSRTEKTICRVPVGKGKIIITCPKCGGSIHGKS